MIRIAEPLPQDEGPYEYRGRFDFDAMFEFTGRLDAADAELQFAPARWYDPTVGRWLNDDPVGFAGDDANHYCYVGNVPE
jgi:RHS repeat-associated protein